MAAGLQTTERPADIMAYPGSVAMAIWAESTSHLDTSARHRTYNFWKVEFDPQDPEESAQAVYRLGLSGALNGATAGLISLQCFVDYDIEFVGRRITSGKEPENIIMDAEYPVTISSEPTDPAWKGAMTFPDDIMAKFVPNYVYAIEPDGVLYGSVASETKPPKYAYYSSGYKRIYTYISYTLAQVHGTSDVLGSARPVAPGVTWYFQPLTVPTRTNTFRASPRGGGTYPNYGNLGQSGAVCHRNTHNRAPATQSDDRGVQSLVRGEGNDPTTVSRARIADTLARVEARLKALQLALSNEESEEAWEVPGPDSPA